MGLISRTAAALQTRVSAVRTLSAPNPANTRPSRLRSSRGTSAVTATNTFWSTHPAGLPGLGDGLRDTPVAGWLV